MGKPNGGSRRPHTKSRLGCQPCKQRHIKCDARGPCCSSCERRKIKCQYADLVDSSIKPVNVPENQPVNTLTPTSDISLMASLINASKPLHGREMQILLQWTTSTSLTLRTTRAPETTWLWQTRIPQIGQSHAFLIHIILSITAAHRASKECEPDEGPYRNLALYHSNEASSSFRQACDNVTISENRTCNSLPLGAPPANAILPYVILTAITALTLLPVTCSNSSFSSDTLSNTNTRDLDNFTSWLIFVRHALAFTRLNPDIANIVAQWREKDINHLHRSGSSPPPALASPTALDPSLLASLNNLKIAASFLPADDAETLQLAIAQTRLWLCLVPMRPNNVMYLFLWLSSMSDAFFALVQRKSTVALAVTAHWLLVVSNIPKPWVWFVADWPIRAIKAMSHAADAAEEGGLLDWVQAQLST